MPNDRSPSTIYRQLALFFGLAYGLTWLFWSPYFLPLGIAIDKLPYVHLLGSLGPMLAALLATVYLKGYSGIRALFSHGSSRHDAVSWLGFALLAPLIIFGLVTGFISFTQQRVPDWKQVFSWGEFSFFSPGIYVLVNIIFFGLGEEVGWRGFVLPRLQTYFSAFTSNLILSGLWAIWHWPLFLNPLGNYSHMDLGGLLGWLFSLVTGGFCLPGCTTPHPAMYSFAPCFMA